MSNAPHKFFRPFEPRAMLRVVARIPGRDEEGYERHETEPEDAVEAVAEHYRAQIAAGVRFGGPVVVRCMNIERRVE